MEQQPKKPVPQQYLPDELLSRIDAGAKKKLWAIDLLYNTRTGETRPFRKRNLYSDELMKFRETMLRYGFTIEVEPGHWKLILPFDIVEVDLYRQDKYLPEPQNNF